MTETDSRPSSTLALNTMLEADFIAPLTAIRGSLELLRDHPDMQPSVRLRFVEAAVRECARLERGLNLLAATVYAEPVPEPAAPDPVGAALRARIRLLPELDIVDLDFSDYVFADSHVVNAFYDTIEAVLAPTGKKWNFAVNFRECRVWPEAWVAFAHRGKKLATTVGIETVRYAAPAETEDGILRQSDDDPNIYPSRDAALARLASARRAERPRMTDRDR